MRVVLRLCLLFIAFSAKIPLAISDCAEELGDSAQSSGTAWGQGKALQLKDMQEYLKAHNVSPPNLTDVAMHYGRAHRGEVQTIAAVKARLEHLKLEVIRLDKLMDDLEGSDPQFKNLFDEFSQISGDHQLQLEALEMMDWATAWELAYGKKDVIDSFNLDERYPVAVEGRSYLPQD